MTEASTIRLQAGKDHVLDITRMDGGAVFCVTVENTRWPVAVTAPIELCSVDLTDVPVLVVGSAAFGLRLTDAAAIRTQFPELAR